MTRMNVRPDGTASISDVTFPGLSGGQLAGVLELPVGTPRAVALMAHCFTCSSSSHASARISAALAKRGYAVLRFDFTGLGSSSGDFADTTFTSNIDDLLAAAAWLRGRWGAPRLLVGHSLGGAAVIAAAGVLPEVQAVVTLGAPACPSHVRHLFQGDLDGPGDRVQVDIGGRPFVVGRRFLDDIAEQPQMQRLAELRRPLLVLHAPGDTIVGIDNARQIFDAARHPKSFVALDGADHLLSDRADAIYVADVIAVWASRHIPTDLAETSSERRPEPGEVHVTEVAVAGFTHEAHTARHTWLVDEPVSVGGSDRGPNPYEVLLSALGACTSMTMRMYAARKGWDFGQTRVTVTHARVHAADCADCGSGTGMVDRIERIIELDTDLNAEQRAALVRIADRCPVHRTLAGEVAIVTTLA